MTRRLRRLEPRSSVTRSARSLRSLCHRASSSRQRRRFAPLAAGGKAAGDCPLSPTRTAQQPHLTPPQPRGSRSSSAHRVLARAPRTLRALAGTRRPQQRPWRLLVARIRRQPRGLRAPVDGRERRSERVAATSSPSTRTVGSTRSASNRANANAIGSPAAGPTAARVTSPTASSPSNTAAPGDGRISSYPSGSASPSMSAVASASPSRSSPMRRRLGRP